MAQIDQSGLERLQHIRNALDSAYDKLEAQNVFDSVQPEFEFITEILEEVKNEWEKI